MNPSEKMNHPPRLTLREKEVLGLLLQGKSNKQIALALGVSTRTVEFHLKNIYTKYQVGSRVELIVSLGQSTGSPASMILGQSTVAKPAESAQNRGNPGSNPLGVNFGRDFSSAYRKVKPMAKRSMLYLLAGFLFGAGYWHYFSSAAKWMNDLTARFGQPDPSLQWLLLPLVLAIYHGVWVFPAVLPAVHEFRRSGSRQFAVTAVILVMISAVGGYYANYIVMLALVGLPNMEHLVLSGESHPNVWQFWAATFPGLILSKFVKWLIINVVIGGLMGILTSSIYSRWVKKNQRMTLA